MLNIQNVEKIRYHLIGKDGFFVERVNNIFDLDPKGWNINNHRYQFDITNRNYTITIMLYRKYEFTLDNDTLYQYKLESGTGNVLYISQLDIQDMKSFTEKLNLAAFGHKK